MTAAVLCSFALLFLASSARAGTAGMTTAAPTPPAAGCGTTPVMPNLGNGSRVNEVVGGTLARPYSWPWQIVWCRHGWFGCSLMCGGTLISNQWVMTAGHCVYGHTHSPGSFRVKLGVFNEGSSSEGGEVVAHVSEIHLHPSYRPNPEPLWDVALVKLSHPVQYTNHIQPICLPTTDTGTISPPNTAWATGWGTTSEGGSISRKLEQVNVPFVDYPTCESEYPGEITEQVMVCAGHRGVDTCQGDSGGPLVHQAASGKWFQYGITSFGQGCAEYHHPGIYSRVTAYCSFIAQTTGGAANCMAPQ